MTSDRHLELSKLIEIIEFITESHLDLFGGYPYDYAIDGDTLWVAELDDGKERARTMLVKYSIKELRRRLLESKEMAQEQGLEWQQFWWDTEDEVEYIE